MSKPSDVQKAFLLEATSKYHGDLNESPAEEYLVGNRGFDIERVKPFRLGYVADPLPGHQMFRGWLSIPYLRWSPGQGWSVIGMRFRCMEDHNHKLAHGGGKYMAHSGGGTHLYNPLSVLKNEREICITEGELDAIAANLAGFPAVGAPGSDTWTPVFARIFRGYERVYVLTDGDKAGREFGERVKATLERNVWIIPMPDEEDVNSVYRNRGKEGLTELIRGV